NVDSGDSSASLKPRLCRSLCIGERGLHQTWLTLFDVHLLLHRPYPRTSGARLPLLRFDRELSQWPFDTPSARLRGCFERSIVAPDRRGPARKPAHGG